MRDFLGQTDDPKPTAALEYRFARRSAATGASSRVANLWELGGGTQLAELLRVVLMPANLCRSTVGITLDMRRPATCTLPATHHNLTWPRIRRVRVEAVAGAGCACGGA